MHTYIKIYLLLIQKRIGRFDKEERTASLTKSALIVP